MLPSSTIHRSLLGGAAGLAVLAFGFGAIAPAAADCKRPAEMDVRYCDENGDLVADAPVDESKWLDPDTLIFSYTPVEDPSVYENVFAEFMDYMADMTGK